MLSILSDRSTFNIFTDIEPILVILRTEGKINRLIRKLKKNPLLTDILKPLLVSGSCPGTLYGLPKIHKEGLPFRPILSAINTPSYHLAQFLFLS